MTSDSTYLPDLFDEHDDDGRPLDNDIDDSPRMVTDPGYELPVSNEIIGIFDEAAQGAILATLAQARDNRRPCPPMKAVDLDAPFERDVLGEALEKTPGVYPMTAQALDGYRTAGSPRAVVIQDYESYQAHRDGSSPERLALLAHVAKQQQRLLDHIADPDAHGGPRLDAGEDEEEAAETEALVGAVAATVIPTRMPARFNGLIEEWHNGTMGAGCMLLPHEDGSRWVASAAESLKKGELEAARAATEAGVPAAMIVGYLPGIGASLAGADALKSLASGAESILQRPEAKGKQPFLVRLDPQQSPAIFALAEVFCLCQQGNAQACKEWSALAAAAPAPVRQAMAEVQAMLKPPQGAAAAVATAVGGAVGDFFSSLWGTIRGLFGSHAHSGAAALPAAAAPKALPPKSGLQVSAHIPGSDAEIAAQWGAH